MFLPNIDTLIFSVNTESYNDAILGIDNYLLERQELAKTMNKNATVFLGDQSFELFPNGARNYKFILHNNQYEIKLQQFYNPNATNLPIMIRLKSEFLWQLRDQAYYEAIKFIESVLGKVKQVKMSRCDLCCHTDKITMSRLKLNRFVTRSTSKEIHIDDNATNTSQKTEVYMTGKQITGLSFGKSPIRCRIYDKCIEIIQSSKKTWFKDIWAEYGITDETVVNVEFQLNREFFKLYKIETYEDLNNEIKTIWLYLTNKWIRYVNVDRSRMEDCTTNKAWEQLSHAYDTDWRSLNGIARHKQQKANEEHLLNMIRCYMVNHASTLEMTDYLTYFSHMFKEVLKMMDDKNLDFEEEVVKKILMR